MTIGDGSERPGEVTRLLQGARAGDRAAIDQLMPLIYKELRAIAGGQLRREGGPHTLQATALVNEAYLKLAGRVSESWQSRAHFLAIAARSMRQILIDHARRKRAGKRGGGWRRTTLGQRESAAEMTAEDVLALEDALETLADRQRQVVECKFFGGMNEEEIAEVLGVSARTVQRDWVKARAWLYRELYPGDD